MITYGELKKRLRAVLWPSPTEARNQRDAHDLFFKEAMVDLSKWVPCLRVDNTSIFDACSTYVQCAKSIVSAPSGLIKRVYTIANGAECDRVYYWSRSFPELERFAHSASVAWQQPANAGMPELPLGFKFHEASLDSPCGRSRLGIYAIHHKRLYLAPWIQSNETIVVEWDGWKRDWNDNDQIDDEEWDEQAQRAIAAYVKWRHEFFYGCDLSKRRDCLMDYQDARAEVKYWCDQKTRVSDEEELPDRAPTYAELQDDAVPAEEVTRVYFANIGDFGSLAHHPAVENVANMIKGKSPEFIITNGDNDYDGDYDLTVGQWYAQYLSPYSGAYGPGASEQRMFPVPGNHDWDVDGTLAAYKAFFNQPASYYELIKGPIHFFMMDSDLREPDGATATSHQAKWLSAKLALSPAQWKIVVIHDPPYTSTSNDTPGILRSRWNFAGADLVISGDGHGYERFEINGLPYIVNGAGGRNLQAFGAPIAGSLVRYNTDWGGAIVTVTCDKLIYEFFNTAGTLIDTLTITK